MRAHSIDHQMSTHKVLDGAAPCNKVLITKLGGEVQHHRSNGQSADLDPLPVLFEDILQQRFFEWLQLAEWARMDGFFLGFQQRLDGIVAETEELCPPQNKQSRHLDTFRGLGEQDALFVLETLHHPEEGQLAPCGVSHAQPPQNASGLGKMRHGVQHGLRNKLGCERMEGWHTPNVHHPF